MSEDRVRVTWEHVSNDDNRKIMDAVTASIGQCGVADCRISGKRKGKSYAVAADFCYLDKPQAEAVIGAAERVGARDVLLHVWHDQSGTEMLYARIGDKVDQFLSIGDLKECRKSLNGPALVFDYGRPRENQTALIRLTIKAARQRQRVADLFRGMLDERDAGRYERFVSHYARLVKTDSLDVKWCALKWKEEWAQWRTGPSEIVNGLRFVIESDPWLFLGFDLSVFSFQHPPTEIEYLVYVLHSLHGVQKVAIKVRPHEHTTEEIYTIYPDVPDDCVVLQRPLTDDSVWPGLYGKLATWP